VRQDLVASQRLDRKRGAAFVGCDQVLESDERRSYSQVRIYYSYHRNRLLDFDLIIALVARRSLLRITKFSYGTSRVILEMG